VELKTGKTPVFIPPIISNLGQSPCCMDLNQFAKQTLDRERPLIRKKIFRGPRPISRQMSLYDLPFFHTVYNVIQNEGRTAATLANIFWEVIIQSEIFPQLLRRAGIRIEAVGRTILSMSGTDLPRFDLLILSPAISMNNAFSLSMDEVFAQKNRFRDFNMFQEWINRQFIELQESDTKYDRYKNDFSQSRALLETLSTLDATGFINDALRHQQFSIIFGPMPKIVRNSAVAKPGIGISLDIGKPPISSSGIVATDVQGRNGVTASMHGVFPTAKEMDDSFNAMGLASVLDKVVYVNGRAGKIVSANYLTDSCFIEVDTTGFPINEPFAGPLRSRSPYEGEKVSFESFRFSGNTVIKEVDIGATSVISNRQVRVYTRAVTNPGDSGSALYNNEKHILGFCHARTGVGEEIEFSEWIWADSVYNALKLIP
jgi:hypothetical protein